MNKILKGLMIQLGADTSGLDKALRNVEAGSRKASGELKEISRAMKDNGDSAVLWSQKQEVLRKALEESQKKLQLLEDTEEEVRRRFEAGTISGEQYRAFQREIENTRSEMNRLQGDLDATTSHLDGLGEGFDDASQHAENAADGGVSALTVALGNLAADGIKKAASALVDFSKDVIETGKNFDSSISNVAAISGATAEEMDIIRQKSVELGATTKFTAKESADAFGYMALAGWDVESMLSGIGGVLDLAAASGMDLARASDIVTDDLTAFGLTAQDSVHFVDMMSYAMSHSNTTTEMLGEAYKNCAATAASLGYTAEDVTAVLMTMANSGIKGGEAGTALNSVMTRLATDTKNCATVLEGYNVHIYDAQGNMQSLSSILQGISGVWQDLNDKQQANLAKAIAGTNHYSALQTIMNGLSDSAAASGMSFGDYAAALEECDGAARNMATTMIDNLAGDMTLLDSAVEGMKIALSQELAPVMREAVQFVTSKIPDIKKSIEPLFSEGAKFVSGLIKQLPTVLEVLSDIAPVLKTVAGVLLTVKAAEKAAAAVKAIQGITAAFAAASTGAATFGAALSAIPAVAAVAAFAVIAADIAAVALSAKDADDEMTKIFEEHQKEMDILNADRQEIGKYKDSLDDSIGSIKESTDRTKDLWKELDELADASGRVQSADKVRAEYILGELNTALGTEYTMTGNQIDNYKQLQEEIDKTIQKKQAEQILDSYYAQTAGMSEKYYEARQDYIDKEQAYTEAEKTLEDARKKYREITGYDYRNVSAEDYLDAKEKGRYSYAKDSKGRYIWRNVTDKGAAAADELKAAEASYGFAYKEMTDAMGNFKETSEFMEKQSELMTEYSKGNYENVAKLAFDVSSIDQSIFEDVNATNDEIETAVKDSLNEIKSEMKLWRETGDSGTAADILDKMGTALNAAQTRGMNGASYFNEFLGSDFRELWKDGGDISAIAQRLMDSGISAGDILGDEYISAVQSQFEHGYNIVPLLQWGAKSGKLTAQNYNKEWDKAVEKELSNPKEHIDASGLMEWWRENGMKHGETYGDLFGEALSSKIQSHTVQTLWATNDLIQATINSLGDLEHRGYEVKSNVQRIAYENAAHSVVDKVKNAFSGFKFMADGGFLRNGQAVVAEAGPELLEVINGGVRVTPLTESSRNSSAGGVQKLFYSNYTINASVSNDADISRLAERLERERRRNEAGKGL